MTTSTDKYMTGTSGVYQTIYANTEITVRMFESTALMKIPRSQATSVWQALITYVDLDTHATRQDLDTLTTEQRDHCRNGAIKELKSLGLDSFGELHKAYVASHYWAIIK